VGVSFPLKAENDAYYFIIYFLLGLSFTYYFLELLSGFLVIDLLFFFGEFEFSMLLLLLF